MKRRFAPCRIALSAGIGYALLLLLLAAVVLAEPAPLANASRPAAAERTLWADAAVSTDGEDRVYLPVLMYHSILKDPARQGKYIVSPDVLEADLLYLQALGYESVTVKSLCAFVDSGAPLPARPVLITFDDGHYNNLTYVLPILKKTGYRAVISVVGAYCDRYQAEPDPNPNYAYLNWDEVRLLAESGVIEIGSHSYDMHVQGARNGAGRRADESVEAYADAFSADAEKMQMLLQTHLGAESTVYAYPFGRIEKESDRLLTALGVRVTFSCREQIACIRRGRPETLLSLGRFNRPAGVGTEEFMQGVLGSMR